MLRSVVVARYGGNLGGRKGVSCTFPRTAYRTWTSHATQMVETGLGGAANEARFRAERDLADNLYGSSANHLCPTTKACPARVLRRGRIPRERTPSSTKKTTRVGPQILSHVAQCALYHV